MSLTSRIPLYEIADRCSGDGISKFLRGTGTKNLGLRGVTPSKTNQFWPIYFLPMDNFATLKKNFFPFLQFSLLFFFLLGILGGMSHTEIFKGDTSPVTPCFRHLWIDVHPVSLSPCKIDHLHQTIPTTKFV